MGYLSQRIHHDGSLSLWVGSAAALALLLSSSGATAQTTLTGGQVIDETWTQAGSPYIVQGDLVVPSGSYLHIEAGVDVQIADGDLQSSTPDAARVAISILGGLQVNGTKAEPVRFHAQTGTSFETWYGIVIASGATEAKLSWMTLEHAQNGLEANDEVIEISACEFATNRYQGVVLNAGATVFDRVLLRDSENWGAVVNGGTVSMTNTIAINNGNFGFFLKGGTVRIVNSAAHNNDIYGMSCTGADVDIFNTNITQNGAFGIFQNAGQVDVLTSNNWGNASGRFSGSVTEASVMSANPDYTDGPGGDLTLQSSSVCIDAGDTTGAPGNDYLNVLRPLDGNGAGGAQHDIGPYEYVAAPLCGDTVTGTGEMCDDGGDNGAYGFCKSDCSGPGPFCGDGTTDAGFEDCDDSNTTPGDGCDENCQDENMGTGGDGGSGGQASSGSGGAGAGSTGGNATGGTADSCLPGEQIACACPGGGTGVQSCTDDGAGYSTCACAPNNEGSENDSGCAIDGSPSKAPSDAALLLLLGAAVLARRRG